MAASTIAQACGGRRVDEQRRAQRAGDVVVHESHRALQVASVVFRLQRNYWNGQETPQLVIIDARKAE